VRAARGAPSTPAHPSNWPSADHDLSNSRQASGSSITAANVSGLAPAWQVPALVGLPTSPVIIGTSVYVEDSSGQVFRLDLASGKAIWKTPPLGLDVGPLGVAVGFGKVFATSGTSVFALDAGTGKQLWSRQITHTKTDGVDIQPQIIGHEVIAASVPVGVKGIYTGGDRGFIDAVNESTGALDWSFDTVASPTLWGNPSVNSGGGAWYPPSYSPSHGLLYMGVANPAPFPGLPKFPNGSSRPGPNLYTDSTVALNPANGHLVWFHQATPHDLFDRDFVHTMVVPLPGSSRTIVVGTGKAGLVVGMNATTGKVLWQTPVGVHRNDNLTALPGPTIVLPGTYGGVLTPPASADGRVYVATLNAPNRLFPNQISYLGAHIGTMPGDVVAIDAATGRHVWDTKVAGDPTGGATVVNDLVLTATVQGTIYALSRATGKIVWQLKAPGGVNGWMSVSGNTIIVPVGGTLKPVIWALRLPTG
jgi:outer membrane protein assembly factor BamB